MKAIQVLLEESLLRRLDRTAKRRHVSRSALIRKSVDSFLRTDALETLIEANRRGYARKPLTKEETDTFRELSKSQERVLEQLADGDRW